MKRVISGVVLLSLLGGSVWSHTPYLFVALGTVVIALALWEFYRLAELVGCKCHKNIGYLTGIVILFDFTYYRNSPQFILPTIIALLIALMITTVFSSKDEKDFQKVLISVAATLLGVFYVVVLAGFLLAVRIDAEPAVASRLLSLFFLIITASDTGAYYVGRTLGKHKLAPLISPGKTIEGSIGGLCFAVIAALIVKYTFFTTIPMLHVIVMAIVMNIIGQMGDLFESVLKRGSGTKDAASIIPGHGGLLDRLDSILFNAPILYYYYIFTTTS